MFNPSNAETTFVPKHKNANLFSRPSKPCHVGTHWKALAEYSHMSTHLPGVFSQFFRFLGIIFVLGRISHQQHKG